MKIVYHLAWREYPVLLLMAFGLLLIIRAVWGECEAGRRYRFGTDRRSLALMRDFRHAVIGLALTAVAAGWYWQVPWLLAVGLVVGAGETCETSADIFALEQAERLPHRHARRLTAGTRSVNFVSTSPDVR